MSAKTEKTEKTERRRLELRRSDKIIMIVVAVQVALILALGILQRFGLSLVNAAVGMYLPFSALFVLVGWGGYALIRRIRNRTVKLAVGGIAAVALMLVLVLVFTYIGFVGAISLPQRYSALSSPSGSRKLVVLRALDTDEERLEARKAARLEEDPEGDTEVTVSDWGYIYRAYPRALGIFYRNNADVEGEIYLAYDEGAVPLEEDEADQIAQRQHGTLMVEWLDDESAAHFFVQDPGIAEGGECTVRFN